MPYKGARHLSPWMYPLIGFVVLILAGTGGIMAFPTPQGAHVRFIDALFLATSATCVTGLTVLDIGTGLALGSQLAILFCIQLGGLGIMALSTALLLLLRRTITFRNRFLTQDTYAAGPTADLHTLLKNVLIFTFFFEAVGTILLYARFSGEMPAGKAMYNAVFHAVSAFCNAGFSLFGDNLAAYRDDPLVSLTVAGLIIIGGIGFLVLHEMMGAPRSSPRRFWRALSLHAKVVLAATGLLLAAGTVFFLACEWNATLAGLPFSSKLLASFFQSVTPRTAGFNTLDFSRMANITLFGTLLLMFIGASPGSAGGGIKTSTVAVLAALSRARMHGSESVHAFRRSIPTDTVNRAFATTVASGLVVLLGTAALLVTELGDTAVTATRGGFLEYLFETTSAFGTVGLSLGVTPGLTAWGKFILVVVMYTGRVGPLVLATAIPAREAGGAFTYAEESVMIG